MSSEHTGTDLWCLTNDASNVWYILSCDVTEIPHGIKKRLSTIVLILFAEWIKFIQTANIKFDLLPNN